MALSTQPIQWTRSDLVRPREANWLFEAMRGRWPLMVCYIGSRTVYVPRDHFYIGGPAGPSDCIWFVPGTFT